jgi:uncharacterized protein
MLEPVGRGARAVAIALIRGYKAGLSPLLGARCRYLPSCSDYASEAIDRHGLWAGSWMSAARICRCHPFGSSGFDPVPRTLPELSRWYKPWTFGWWTGRHITLRPRA